MALLMTKGAVSRVENSGNDLATVAEVVSAHRRGNHAMPFGEARRYAQGLMKGQPAMRSVDIVTMKADDSVDLIRFGPRGGWRRITRLLDREGQPV